MSDRFGDLIASARDILATLDRSGSFTFVSPAIQSTLGLIPTEIVGSVLWELVHPRDVVGVHSTLREVFDAGGRRSLDFQMVDVTGRWHELRATFQLLDGESPPLAALVASDVTEVRRLTAALQEREEQLKQARKMEVVGRLATGISHDFGNLLTIIIGATARMLEQLPDDSPLGADTRSIQLSAERAASMVRQILGFGRQRADAATVLDLNDVVRETEQLLTRLLGEHIQLQTICGAGLWTVRADRTQIEQILLNLGVNARDAMPSGGLLTIETRNLAADDPASKGGTPSVLVSVTDTGIGMDAATQAHAFDPFFTTKPMGQGTGVGLATVQQIVREGGGWTALSSAVGKGTTVSFALPREDASATAATTAVAAPGGSETLLLVEDEEGVRELVRDMLMGAGYTVLEAAVPSDAERLCQSADASIDLLVTDVVMPEMSGLELATRLRGYLPDLQVMFMSGFPEPMVGDSSVEVPGAHFISKPFNRPALLQCVRRALDARSRRESA
jgi:two-component system, cell cycle sensor histidine kinase and response regulator CckA